MKITQTSRTFQQQQKCVGTSVQRVRAPRRTRNLNKRSRFVFNYSQILQYKVHSIFTQLLQPLMKVSFVSPKYWALKLPFLAVQSALQLVFLCYSTLLILIYTKIRLHIVTVCSSGPCIELPDLGYIRDKQKANEAACFDYREKMSLPICAEFVLGWLGPR